MGVALSGRVADSGLGGVAELLQQGHRGVGCSVVAKGLDWSLTSLHPSNFAVDWRLQRGM